MESRVSNIVSQVKGTVVDGISGVRGGTGGGSEGEGFAGCEAGEGSDLQKLNGIGETFEERLNDAGVDTIEALAEQDSEALAEQTGIALGRVETLIDRAGEVVVEQAVDDVEGEDGEEAERDEEFFDTVGELHKDFVAPNNVQKTKTHVETDYDFVKCYYVKSWPREVFELFLQNAINSPDIDCDISFHMNPRPDERAKKQLEQTYHDLELQRIEEEQKGNLKAQDTQEAVEGVEMLREFVTQQHRKVYDIATYVTVRAGVQTSRDSDDNPGLDNLNANARKLISTLERYAGTSSQLAKSQQIRAMKSTAPLARDELGKETAMLGDAAAAMFPFTSNQVLEPGGVNLGINIGDDSPVIVDPFNRENGYNQLRIGQIGSGKSFAGKQFLLRQAMSDPDIEIIVVDPMGGFLGINEAIGGDWIQVEGKETINPLEIEETPQHVIEGSDVDPWSNKLADVRWFFDQFFQINGNELTNEEKSVLMRAVKQAYSANGITPDPSTHHNTSPTIEDVVDWVTKIQEEPKEHSPASTDTAVENWRETAAAVEMALEPFRADGEYANLSGKTDLELGEGRMTYIDISQISARAGTQSLMMQILFSMLYQRIKQSDRKTIMVIDEAHKILKNSQNLTFFEEVFRHSRHFDLSIQLISQTLEEFFVNESARAIANQCVVKFVHRIPGINKELAKDVLDFNEQTIQFVETAEPGEGEKNYSEALVQIDDIGDIPLRIHATQDEQAVITYNPGEEWDALTEPSSNRIRNALDRSLRTRHDIDSADFELADRVEAHLNDEVADEVASDD